MHKPVTSSNSRRAISTVRSGNADVFVSAIQAPSFSATIPYPSGFATLIRGDHSKSVMKCGRRRTAFAKPEGLLVRIVGEGRWGCFAGGHPRCQRGFFGGMRADRALETGLHVLAHR